MNRGIDPRNRSRSARNRSRGTSGSEPNCPRLLPPKVRFALDSPLEGDGFEPSSNVLRQLEFVDIYAEQSRLLSGKQDEKSTSIRMRECRRMGDEGRA
jgi:hypothetical protein